MARILCKVEIMSTLKCHANLRLVLSFGAETIIDASFVAESAGMLQFIALTRESPEQNNLPLLGRWSRANWPAMRSGGASSTASRTTRAGNLSVDVDFKRHRVRDWLSSKPDPAFETTCANICSLYPVTCSFQGTTFVLRIDRLTRLTRMSGAVPGSMDCR
jgi:hypothetical protein